MNARVHNRYNFVCSCISSFVFNFGFDYFWRKFVIIITLTTVKPASKSHSFYSPLLYTYNTALSSIIFNERLNIASYYFIQRKKQRVLLMFIIKIKITQKHMIRRAEKRI